jgi:hypothetical protein
LTDPGPDPEEDFQILLGDYQAIKKYVRLQEEGIQADEEEIGRPKEKIKRYFIWFAATNWWPSAPVLHQVRRWPASARVTFRHYEP